MTRCKDCITYAICKSKPMIQVVGDCSIVRDILKNAQEEDKLKMKQGLPLEEKYYDEFEKLSIVLGMLWSDTSHYATAKRLIWIWLDEGRY